MIFRGSSERREPRRDTVTKELHSLTRETVGAALEYKVQTLGFWTLVGLVFGLLCLGLGFMAEHVLYVRPFDVQIALTLLALALAYGLRENIFYGLSAPVLAILAYLTAAAPLSARNAFILLFICTWAGAACGLYMAVSTGRREWLATLEDMFGADFNGDGRVGREPSPAPQFVTVNGQRVDLAADIRQRYETAIRGFASDATMRTWEKPLGGREAYQGLIGVLIAAGFMKRDNPTQVNSPVHYIPGIDPEYVIAAMEWNEWGVPHAPTKRTRREAERMVAERLIDMARPDVDE